MKRAYFSFHSVLVFYFFPRRVGWARGWGAAGKELKVLLQVALALTASAYCRRESPHFSDNFTMQMKAAPPCLLASTGRL